MSRRPTVPRTSLSLLLSVLLATAGAAVAGPSSTGWSENFEGPTPSWQEAGGDSNHAIQQHRRVSGVAHSGQNCEWLQLAGQGGSSAYVAHDIGRPWVIDDLAVGLWVKSDRAGLQLLAEIVLPRTIDPRTNQPLVTHLFGSTYTTTGRWQRLGIQDIPRELNRQARMLRSQRTMAIDEREAYVNRLLVNVYGGPGTTNVWFDDLEVAGHVSATGRASDRPAIPATAGQTVGLPRSPTEVGPMADTPTREVQLTGSVLMVQGRPMFPRAIEHQGEPLGLLKQLGFNVVWLRQAPTAPMLEEARQLGLWLICPPPQPPPSGDRVGPPVAIGPEYQQVLAWDLGRGLMAEQVEPVRRWAEQIRLADARRQRPLVAAPLVNLRDYSRHVDLLVIDRRPLGTSLEMADYGLWVRREPLMARPGTPVWTTIQTQPSEGLLRQLAALSPGARPPTALSPEQVRLLVYTAISCGSRGLLFLSQSPLDGRDPETRLRAMTLQLLNLELDLIEPWVAAGTSVALAASNEPQVNGAVLRSGRSRLVLPAWLAQGSQCVVPRAAATPLAMVVPSVPESSNAYEIAAGRLQPLRHNREAGGTRVTLDQFNVTGLVLLAQDPLIIDAVNRRATAGSRTVAELHRSLAAQRIDAFAKLIDPLARRTPPQISPPEGLARSRQSLQQCDARLAAGDPLSAALEAQAALRPLRHMERDCWEKAVAGMGSPVASPGATGFATLLWHWSLIDRLRGCRAGSNLLVGGNFEDFNLMLQSGWRNCQQPTPGVQSATDLMAEAARSGRWGLRLTARADDPENPPAMLETPPQWIVTPPLAVQAGQIVRIHGWVQIPSAILGSVDGLMITDSLGGPDLAERIDKTAGWREFTLFRAAAESGPMTVTFALTGLGEARLDDVTIEVMARPMVQVGRRE